MTRTIPTGVADVNTRDSDPERPDGRSHRLMVQGVDGVCDDPHEVPRSLGLLVVTYPDGGSKVIERRPEDIRDECQTRDGVIPP